MSGVVLRCIVGGCHKKMYFNSSVTKEEYITFNQNLLRKFNVSTPNELVAIYKCRSCRAGKPVNVRTQVQTQISTENVEVKKLKLVGEGINVDMNKYSNFVVGFEFEGNIINTSLGSIATKYGLYAGKTLGIGKVMKILRLADRTSIEIPVEDNLYNSERIVTQVYNDGTVGAEVVTRPLSLNELKYAEDVFKYLKLNINMKVKDAGLHMTFLLNHHKELSSFDKLIVQNAIQLFRYYYRELIYIYNAKTYRGTSYRYIRTLTEDSMKSISTLHHNAINLRKDGNNIWGIEVRIPDGTDEWENIVNQVKFYMALFRHAAKISQKGLIYIEQEHWNKVKKFDDENTNELKNLRVTDEIKTNINDLLKRLEKDIKFFNSNNEVESIDDLYEMQKEAVTIRGE